MLSLDMSIFAPTFIPTFIEALLFGVLAVVYAISVHIMVNGKQPRSLRRRNTLFICANTILVLLALGVSLGTSFRYRKPASSGVASSPVDPALLFRIRLGLEGPKLRKGPLDVRPRRWIIPSRRERPDTVRHLRHANARRGRHDGEHSTGTGRASLVLTYSMPQGVSSLRRLG